MLMTKPDLRLSERLPGATYSSHGLNVIGAAAWHQTFRAGLVEMARREPLGFRLQVSVVPHRPVPQAA